MKVQVTMLATLWPLAIADWHLGFPVDTSVMATSSSFGGYVCDGPYPGGFVSDPHRSHPFYLGADCVVMDGQPLNCFADIFGGVINGAFLAYLVLVLEKQVGRSPYLRDFCAYFFWQSFAFCIGSVFHVMAFIGSQYKNAADVPEWVYFLGKNCLAIHFNGDTADGWILMVISFRLLLEPLWSWAFPRIHTGYFWAIFHAVVYFYMIPMNFIGFFRDGSTIYPMASYEKFMMWGNFAFMLYGIGGHNLAAVFAGFVGNSGFFYDPNPSWQYFDNEAFGHFRIVLGNFFVFLAATDVLRKYSRKLNTD